MVGKKELAYEALALKSWQVWKRDWLRLLVPDVLNSLVSVSMLALLVGFEFLLLLILGYNVLDYVDVQNWQTDLIKETPPIAVILWIITFIFIDVVVSFLIFVYFHAMKVGLYYDAVEKKVELRKMWLYAVKYYRIVLKIEATRIVVALLPLGALLFLGVFSSILSGLVGTPWRGIGILAGLLSVLVFLGCIAIMWYGLYFTYPLLAVKKDVPRAWPMMREAWQFVRAHRQRFFMTVLIIVAVWLVVSAALFIIGLVLALPFALLKFTTVLVVLDVIGNIVSFVVEFLLGVYNRLLRYHVCYAKD